jgi:hypothetical protein
VFCKPLLQFFLLLSFNKPIHYYPNSNNQYHYQRYFHQSPIEPFTGTMSLMSYIFCFKVSGNISHFNRNWICRFTVNENLYTRNHIFRNQTALSRISWLTHNDRYFNRVYGIRPNYFESWCFKIWKFNFDKVSTDALTVNLNSAPFYFGSVYTSLSLLVLLGKTEVHKAIIVGKLYSFFMSSLRQIIFDCCASS